MATYTRKEFLGLGVVLAVILERDPHDADPDDIRNIGVVRTVVGGRTMHPATA